jgi:hypothetical protein
MEVTFPINVTHADATPMILPVVLAGVDFPEAVEGVVPSEAIEGAGSSSKILD